MHLKQDNNGGEATVENLDVPVTIVCNGKTVLEMPVSKFLVLLRVQKDSSQFRLDILEKETRESIAGGSVLDEGFDVAAIVAEARDQAATLAGTVQEMGKYISEITRAATPISTVYNSEDTTAGVEPLPTDNIPDSKTNAQELKEHVFTGQHIREALGDTNLTDPVLQGYAEDPASENIQKSEKEGHFVMPLLRNMITEGGENFAIFSSLAAKYYMDENSEKPSTATYYGMTRDFARRMAVAAGAILVLSPRKTFINIKTLEKHLRAKTRVLNGWEELEESVFSRSKRYWDAQERPLKSTCFPEFRLADGSVVDTDTVTDES